MTALRERVRLAQTVEKAQHQVKKRKKDQGWFKRAALDADLELDSDLGGSDEDDDGPKRKGSSWERKGPGSGQDTQRQLAQLQAMLAKKVVPKGISGKYLTGNADASLASVLMETTAAAAPVGVEGEPALRSSAALPTKRASTALLDVQAGPGAGKKRSKPSS
jgi:hypothetical protein